MEKKTKKPEIKLWCCLCGWMNNMECDRCTACAKRRDIVLQVQRKMEEKARARLASGDGKDGE